MDRYLLIVSTVCFLAAVVRTIVALRAGVFRLGRFNFLTVGLGFIFQTAFLSIRGHALGRCPMTNLFEVFVFLAWSIALIYMLIGPAYRLSLMGAFTAPIVFVIQIFALLWPIDVPQQTRPAVNPWLEFHASMGMIAYGAFAMACVAGLMYLVQERQLKTRHLHSIFHHLPPLRNGSSLRRDPNLRQRPLLRQRLPLVPARRLRQPIQRSRRARRTMLATRRRAGRRAAPAAARRAG